MSLCSKFKCCSFQWRHLELLTESVKQEPGDLCILNKFKWLFRFTFTSFKSIIVGSVINNYTVMERTSSCIKVNALTGNLIEHSLFQICRCSPSGKMVKLIIRGLNYSQWTFGGDLLGRVYWEVVDSYVLATSI